MRCGVPCVKTTAQQVKTAALHAASRADAHEQKTAATALKVTQLTTHTRTKKLFQCIFQFKNLYPNVFYQQITLAVKTHEREALSNVLQQVRACLTFQSNKQRRLYKRISKESFTSHKAHKAASLAVRHQFTLPDYRYGASASRGVPVHAPAFAGSQCA